MTSCQRTVLHRPPDLRKVGCPVSAPRIPAVHPAEHLLDRLAAGDRPVVFLVGSALTMPVAGSRGVSDVAGILELVRARLGAPKGDDVSARLAARAAVAELDDALARAPDGGARYQLAFEHLKSRMGGAASANAVIRQAVLRARTEPVPEPLPDPDALARLEASPHGWHLGRAAKALGLVVARHRERFGRMVLTTNFDPLVEIAVRAAGGETIAVDQLGDGALPSPDARVTPVVHLHGLWRSDTLHTPGSLTLDRAALQRSLARLSDEVTIVVIGYGGWDDVITAALAELASDVGTTADVLWCFYERDPEAIGKRYPKVLATLARLRERAVCYGGVDCHALLPRLRARLDGEGELVGRGPVCNALLDALDGERAVEIIGERHMKRSQLLSWMSRQTAAFGKRAACFNARELASPTPEALVRKVADAVGLGREVEDELHRERSVPTHLDAARALRLLHGTWILIDDAEALAGGGRGSTGHAAHGFTETFFDALRAKVEAKELHWMSVSKTPLCELFRQEGLTSRFLNDATKIYAGGLDRTEVEVALHARLGPRATEALSRAGTLPRLVYRLCDAEWGDVDAALASLPDWAEGVCTLWWSRTETERALLGRIARGTPCGELSSRERSDAAELCKRGLLVEVGDQLALNGAVWEDYVRRRP